MGFPTTFMMLPMLLPVTQLGYQCCPTDLSLHTAIQQTLLELPSVTHSTLGAGDPPRSWSFLGWKSWCFAWGISFVFGEGIRYRMTSKKGENQVFGGVKVWDFFSEKVLLPWLYCWQLDNCVQTARPGLVSVVSFGCMGWVMDLEWFKTGRRDWEGGEDGSGRTCQSSSETSDFTLVKGVKWDPL